MACNNAKIGNRSRIYISDVGANPASSDFEEVLLATSITLPSPTRNMVDTPFLNQANDYTQRLPGSMTGADMTFNVGMTDATNQGLEDLMTYLETGQCVSVLVTLNTDKDDTGETGFLIRGAYVTQVSPQEIGTDTQVLYAVTIAANALVEKVKLPVVAS